MRIFFALFMFMFSIFGCGDSPHSYMDAHKATWEEEATWEKKEYNCVNEYSPVCSAENVTYGNLCFLEAAGEQFWREGACGEVPNLRDIGVLQALIDCSVNIDSSYHYMYNIGAEQCVQYSVCGGDECGTTVEYGRRAVEGCYRECLVNTYDNAIAWENLEECLECIGYTEE